MLRVLLITTLVVLAGCSQASRLNGILGDNSANSSSSAVSPPTPTPQPTVTPTPAPTATTSPLPGTPSAPQTPVAYAGVTSAQAIFGAPSSDGGSPLLSYTTTAYTFPGNVAAASMTMYAKKDANALSAYGLVNGLVSGQQYVLRAKATNAKGAGPESANSNIITPSPYAVYYITNGNNPSSTQGQNTAWSNFDFPGGNTSWNDTTHVYKSQANSLKINTDTISLPYYIDPLVTSQASPGMFNYGPYSNIIVKVYVTRAAAGTVNFAHRANLFVYGKCTAGSGANKIVDDSQNWSPISTFSGSNTAVGFIGPTGGGLWGTYTTSANGFSVPGSRTWAPGDIYFWAHSDEDFTGNSTVPVDPYVTSPQPGALTANAWNVIAMPISALPSTPNFQGWVPNTLQELGLQNLTGSDIWATDWGFQ